MLASIDMAPAWGSRSRSSTPGAPMKSSVHSAARFRSRAGGVIDGRGCFLWSQRGRIVELAARQRIPVIYPK